MFLVDLIIGAVNRMSVIEGVRNQLETARKEANSGRFGSALEWAQGSLRKLEGVGITKGRLYDEANVLAEKYYVFARDVIVKAFASKRCDNLPVQGETSYD